MKIQINRLFFTVFLLLINSFLFLPIKHITSMQLAAAISILYIIIFLDKVINAKSAYKKLVFILLGYILFEMIRTKCMYGNIIGIKDMLYRSIEFFSLPLIFLLLPSFANNYEWYIKCIKKIGLLTLIALVGVGIIYSVLHIQMIEEIFERSGRARILYGIEFLTIVWLLYLAEICKRINEKKRILKSSLFFLVAEPIYQMIFSQIRLLVVFQVFFILAAILFVIKSQTKKSLCFEIVLILGLAFMIIPTTSRYIIKILEMFNSSDSSMYARISQIQYYPNLIVRKPFCGYGTISGPNFSDLITGQYGVFCPEDLGIIGFTFFYGIFGTMIFICIVMVYLLKAIKYRKSCPEAFFLELFLIISSATMFMFDIQRGPLMVLFLVIIEGSIKCYENIAFGRNEKQP